MKKYVREMVLEAICEYQQEWFMSKDRVNELSEKLERKVSTHEIAHYIKYYCDRNFIIRERVKDSLPYKYKIKDRDVLCK